MPCTLDHQYICLTCYIRQIKTEAAGAPGTYVSEFMTTASIQAHMEANHDHIMAMVGFVVAS